EPGPEALDRRRAGGSRRGGRKDPHTTRVFLTASSRGVFYAALPPSRGRNSNRRHRCPQGRCIEHVGVIRTKALRPLARSACFEPAAVSCHQHEPLAKVFPGAFCCLRAAMNTVDNESEEQAEVEGEAGQGLPGRPALP